MLQGAEGSQVVLSVRPGSTGTAKDVRLTRQPIVLNPVDFALCSSSGAAAVAMPAAHAWRVGL